MPKEFGPLSILRIAGEIALATSGIAAPDKRPTPPPPQIVQCEDLLPGAIPRDTCDFVTNDPSIKETRVYMKCKKNRNGAYRRDVYIIERKNRVVPSISSFDSSCPPPGVRSRKSPSDTSNPLAP